MDNDSYNKIFNDLAKELEEEAAPLALLDWADDIIIRHPYYSATVCGLAGALPTACIISYFLIRSPQLERQDPFFVEKAEIKHLFRKSAEYSASDKQEKAKDYRQQAYSEIKELAAKIHQNETSGPS